MSTTPQVVDTSKRVILDYTSRDYKSIRSMLVGLASGLMPEWETVGETGDFGTLLLEMYAYTGDIMNYYIDKTGSEAFLGTAARRQSVLYIADMFGYTPLGQRAATVPIVFNWTWDTDNLTGGVVPVYTYKVDSATATNGLVTMGITSDTFSILLVPGQTITVSGAGEPFDGRFVIDSVADATVSTPLQVTYKVASSDLAIAEPDESSLVTTGSVVIVPARTRISTDADTNGQVFTFETDIDVVLDTAAGKSTVAAPTIFTVVFQTTASEGITTPPYLIGTSQGIPNAEFVINDLGVIDRTVEVFTKEGGAVLPWANITKMALATPTQSVYTIFVDDQNYTHIMFGDGASGRVPPANTEIYIGYRYGAGQAANALGVGSVSVLNNEFATSLGITVSNTAAPVGGADVESTDSMRFSIPRSNALKQRAVTLEDYINLALQVPGITKATAYGENYTSVYVRIASGPMSQGYSTTPVTGMYISTATTPAMATLTLTNDYSIVLGEFFYVDNVRDDINGTQAPVNIWLSATTATEIDGDLDPPDLTAHVVTLKTLTAHNYQQGQPITVNGITQAAFNGTHIITAVPNATEVQYRVATAGPTTGSIISHAYINATPGFTYETDSTVATIPGVGLEPVWQATAAQPVLADSPTATTVDPEMQKLINAVEEYLDDKKLIGSVVYGEPVEWTNADVNIKVFVRPLYNRESVRSAVQAAVMSVFDYNNVDFGRRISIGDVYRAALSTDGVDYITLNRLAETTGFTNTVVQDINSTEDYALTVTGASMESGIATITTYEVLNLAINDPITIDNVGTSFDGSWLITDVLSPQSFTYDTETALNTVVSPMPLDATATQVNVENAYRIPRINPNLGTPWVTAVGGLVNT